MRFTRPLLVLAILAAPLIAHADSLVLTFGGNTYSWTMDSVVVPVGGGGLDYVSIPFTTPGVTYTGPTPYTLMTVDDTAGQGFPVDMQLVGSGVFTNFTGPDDYFSTAYDGPNISVGFVPGTYDLVAYDNINTNPLTGADTLIGDATLVIDADDSGANDSGGNSGDPGATPEPASLILVGTGLFGLAGITRRPRKSGPSLFTWAKDHLRKPALTLSAIVVAGLLLAPSCANADPIVIFGSGGSGSALGVNGIVVNGQTYNVTFDPIFPSYTGEDTFVGDAVDASTAASEIGAALDGTSTFLVLIGSGNTLGAALQFIVETTVLSAWDNQVTGIGITANGGPTPWVIFSTDATPSAIAAFTLVDSGDGSSGDNSGDTGVVPEPASLILAGTGLLGLAGMTRKRLART